jgi:hypothetical protein
MRLRGWRDKKPKCICYQRPRLTTLSPRFFNRISRFSILQHRLLDSHDHADAEPYRTSPDAVAGEKQTAF